MNAPASEGKFPGYPPGSLNANTFSFFNAVAFQVMMGAPIILYAKSIGASSTVLGIIAAFTPIMTIFQLPAAQFLPRYGYRQFILMGWGTRTIFIFIVALVPVMGFLDHTGKMAVLLASLFFFNMLRGIASCAWYPWISELIPEEIRGRFLSRDQFFTHLGSLMALGVSAVLMWDEVVPVEYTMVFLLSAVAQTASLYFLRRIPEMPASEQTRRSAQSVPWGAMIFYAPFTRLLIFNLIYMLAVGGLGVFTVEFLRDVGRLDPSVIMILSSFAFVAALIAMPVVGRVIDRVGNRVMLRIALALFSFVAAGWMLVSSNVLPIRLVIISVLTFTAGLAGALFNLTNIRLTMSIMPVMGRNHFFALFSVVTSLGLGAAPVLWGVSLDAIGTYEAVTGWFHWKRHSLYFLAIFLLTLVGFLAVSIVREGKETAGDVRLFEARLRRFGRDWLR